MIMRYNIRMPHVYRITNEHYIASYVKTEK